MVILVTGGTSGLGLELVRILLKKGNFVIAIGRNQLHDDLKTGNFIFYRADFSDLQQVAETAKVIARDHSPDCVVNNAGILSPPAYTETRDGFEYTFQVNFLAHMLMDEIIIRFSEGMQSMLVASVTSPVYRIAPFDTGIGRRQEDYRPFRSYMTSKLFLAMTAEYLASRHPYRELHYFSYDPGTFSSGIYRMQKRWFRTLYYVAAPFMRHPSGVAGSLAELITTNATSRGMVYNRLKDAKSLKGIAISRTTAFMDECYSLIEKYI